MQRIIQIGVIVGIVVVSALTGPSNIDSTDKYAWSENAGWLNWRDANGGADGVQVHPTYLSGKIWAENLGWINVGNGSPANGTSYANDPLDSSTFGVNIDPPTGDLFGLGWGENIGWVNFDTRAALGPTGDQARFAYDGAGNYWSGRFRGYAWSENVGWINLDDATHYVAMVPINCNDPFADADGDNDVEQSDFGIFQRCFSSEGIGAVGGCACFDRPEDGFPYGDNDVDAVDLAVFEACVSGPTIIASQDCDD